MMCKMKREKKLINLLTFILVFLLAACAKDGSESGKHKGKSKKEQTAKVLKIGVILPLSGKYGVYGRSVLHGIECATGIKEPCKKQLNAELVVRNSDEETGGVDTILTSLADEGVVAVIGPLLSADEIALAMKANELKIPIISLAQAGSAEDNQYLFRNNVTSSDEINALLDYSFNEKKLKRYYVLYPRSKKGTEYFDLFKSKADELGGEVVGKLVYIQDQIGFIDEFKKTYEEGLSKVAGSKRIDAIFIPDSYWAVGKLASAIDLVGIQNVQLLGTSRWNNHRLISEAGEFVDGAIFVDAFYKNSSDEIVRNFIDDFQAAYGVEPTLLEALGFDSAKLILSVVPKEDLFSRELVRRTLSGLKEFKSVTGELKAGEHGRFERKLKLLTIKKGRITEL